MVAGSHGSITILLADGTMDIVADTVHGRDRAAPAVGSFAVSLAVPDEWQDEVAFAVIDDQAAPVEAAEPFDCVVRLRRAGCWLVVNDNGSCGGEGVSYSGLYERPLSR